MLFGKQKKLTMVDETTALPGRDTALSFGETHHVFGRPLTLDVPEGHEVALFGMGCYWGVERIFWQQPGVWLTMVGNAGGFTPNPTYDELCTGQTGHTEVVRVVYDPAKTSYEALLKVFWENHDPTQGMRQGNDMGTQYRSAIYATTDAQLDAARLSAAEFAPRLAAQGFGAITTEIAWAGGFYPAEAYHQQYLSKNPGGYCGIGGTGVTCPIGTGA
ncbi:Peptide methionine sulfoxide reductase MsrA [Aliiroseovarius sp. xm-m-379]|uniref:peptide-methionine (S)-S-oxide reductase MsrA n=1 Tax=unclassified Aliiroseovarius TaxID=2623558 RepID=UPI0015694719|nr:MULTISPECIES: peptide-methionine (S)-S-oxide reductase MsrA [unclassified Aliiroseovarius]NRP24395.1 Peptide methionine sulfoxide reductase MsrA [Aliiroseovarius sp. xm-m-379]NRP33194.1 Peptide methionine sulfoxide reductase MsrA [Aliiroseovarius sp. xm-a-104]NRP49360.1 Peptide methionine sulfoxide reductase MsrA [Aliiroseovarius sp. xm-m-354]NRQ04115.1 Peptide methionine sulfoxide reductase MsrA [Aliiroseovarius sp. xm-m-309]NRQ07319.1 Peptide methionine sulfoxide reductase MsrA [Aliiroseo